MLFLLTLIMHALLTRRESLRTSLQIRAAADPSMTPISAFKVFRMSHESLDIDNIDSWAPAPLLVLLLDAHVDDTSLSAVLPRPLQTGSVSARVPLEIEFLIIDQFDGDVVRLRQLCLISRAWAAHAQSRLFRDVYVRYNNIKSFLAVIQTKRQLGRHITTLHVIEGSQWSASQPGHLSVLDAISPLVVDKMPNLHTLDLRYRWFLTAPALECEGISQLQVRFCRFATIDIMCYTQDIHAGIKPSLQSRICLPAWHLKYLAFGEFPQNALIDWMVDEPAELTVDHFRILSLGPDASAFNALLDKIGGGLQRLELPEMHRWVTGPEVALSIRACTSLTTLCFSERSAYDLGRGIISVLKQTTSPSLATVSFQIHLNTGYLDIPWEEVEGVLSGTMFTHLNTVVFNMWGGPFEYAVLTPYEEAVLLMRDRMVLLEERGMLRFTYADDTQAMGQMFGSVQKELPPLTLRQRAYRRVARWMGRGERREVVTLMTL
ncbi:hypothetical protein DFH06DRAFT_1472259 [Mycena polygramma]|nr:hypothetical protein DFH06DRAFT_1472259 [Mycena polygramma]